MSDIDNDADKVIFSTEVTADFDAGTSTTKMCFSVGAQPDDMLCVALKIDGEVIDRGWGELEVKMKSADLNFLNRYLTLTPNHDELTVEVEGWRLESPPDASTFYLPRGEAVARPIDRPNLPMTASEALYAFTAWLTGRKEEVTFSSHHDASIAVELIAKFCEANGLEEPREGWTWLIQPIAE